MSGEIALCPMASAGVDFSGHIMFWLKRNSSGDRPTWSDDPGQFELHLVRRINNPLFHRSRRKVTASELTEAQERDRRASGEFCRIAAEFLSAPPLSPSQSDYPVALGNRFKGALELLTLAARIGGPFQREQAELEEVVKDSMDALFAYHGQDDGPKDFLRKFEALSRMEAFMAQFGGSDCPMLNDLQEDVRSALCLDDESLSIYAQIMAGMGARGFVDKSQTILAEAVKDGYPVIEARRKRGIIEAEYERAAMNAGAPPLAESVP
jgi:hypothetical protein